MAKVTIHLPSRESVVVGGPDDSFEDLSELSKTLKAYHDDPTVSVLCVAGDSGIDVVVLKDVVVPK